MFPKLGHHICGSTILIHFAIHTIRNSRAKRHIREGVPHIIVHKLKALDLPGTV